MIEIQRYKLDAAFAHLKDWDAFSKDEDFIEVSL